MQVVHLPTIHHIKFEDFINYRPCIEIFGAITINQDDFKLEFKIEFSFLHAGIMHKHIPGNKFNFYKANGSNAYDKLSKNVDEVYESMIRIIKEKNIAFVPAKLSYDEVIGNTFKTAF